MTFPLVDWAGSPWCCSHRGVSGRFSSGLHRDAALPSFRRWKLKGKSASCQGRLRPGARAFFPRGLLSDPSPSGWPSRLTSEQRVRGADREGWGRDGVFLSWEEQGSGAVLMRAPARSRCPKTLGQWLRGKSRGPLGTPLGEERLLAFPPQCPDPLQTHRGLRLQFLISKLISDSRGRKRGRSGKWGKPSGWGVCLGSGPR